MDEISRELPADTTKATGVEEQEKGPRELLLHERQQLQEDLVVRTPEDECMPEHPDEPTPESDRSASTEATPEAVTPEETAPEERDPDPLDPDPLDPDPLDPGQLARALADEASVAEVREDLEAGGLEDDGLPAVPEITNAAELAKQVYVLMLSSREGLSLFRLARACNTTQKLVEEAIGLLEQQLQGIGLPVELSRTGDTVKWMAKDSTFPFLQRLRGVKKLERLSPAALETLAVVAYRQPVMRSEIEAIRGVKAGPMLRTLLHHKLIRVTGRADVPGKPLQYGTTQQFLERFGLASTQELPSMKEWENLG